MRIQNLQIALLKTEVYQRVIDAKDVAKIINEFNEELLGVITVTKRSDGYYNIVDGQHRVVALATMGISDVNCCVIENCKNEAALFIALNKNRKPIPTPELYNASFIAGDSNVIDIDNIVKNNGLEVARNSSKNKIIAVNALYFVKNRYGIDNLDLTLNVIKQIYEGSQNSLTSPVIKGFAYLIYKTNIVSKSLVEKMKKYPIQRLINTGKQRKLDSGCSEEKAYAGAILEIYNDNRKNKVFAEL